MITLRVFLSSPSDVAVERSRAHGVVAALHRAPAWRGRVHVDLVAWDDPRAPVPMDATRTPQHSVNVHAGRPSDCDLTVVLLWSRLGTPVPPARDGESGWPSGTVWELDEARAAGRPVWIYRCQRPLLLDADDPALPESRHQRDAVCRFFDQLEGGFNNYDDADDFARQLGLHLEAELRRRLDAQAAAEAGVRDEFLQPALLDPASVLQRVNLARFVGRAWLIEGIDRFVACQPRGVAVVEGAAGMGKSAFMAHLASTRGWVAHYCELTPGVDGVSTALRNLAAQLIRRWHLPSVLLAEVLPGQATRADFLQRLLADAAIARDRRAPGERIVVAVDALDEAGTPPGQNVLGLPRRLPDGVFLVVSTRPVPVALEVDAPRLLLRLQADDPRNQQDAATFLRATAARPVVAAELQRLSIAPAEFEERLLRISRGVWIYLVHVLHEIEAGERLPLDMDSLPDGIWQYYARYWMAWKQRHPAAWAALALDLLGTLAAAREDLGAVQLSELLPGEPGAARDNAVRGLLHDAWAPFLVRTAPAGGEPVFRLYHASLREFVGGRYPAGDLTAGEQRLGDELAAATQRAHARMAERLWSLLPGATAEAFGPFQAYGVHHLVAHLLAAARIDDVGRLLRTGRRIVQPLAFALDGAAETIEEPLWYAVNLERGLAEAFAGGVKEWLAARAARPGHASGPDELFGRYVLASVSRHVDRVPPALLRALCDSGVWTLEQALAHVRLCADAQRRCEFARAVLPLAAASTAVWPFACDIARAFDCADERVELLLLLFDHAAPALRGVAAAELMHAAVRHRLGPCDAAWAALALHWDALGNAGLRVQCLQSLAGGAALMARASALSGDGWFDFLATEAGMCQAPAVLARAGAAIAADTRLDTCATAWARESRWAALLAAATARAQPHWAHQALEGLINRGRVPPLPTLALALGALDLLSDAAALEGLAPVLWQWTAQSALGSDDDDALFAALAGLRCPPSREALRDAAGGPAGDGPFDIVCRWLLAADRAAALAEALQAQASLGDPWRGYVLGALARHGAPARDCWNASAGIADAVFLAEALAPAAPALSPQTRMKGLQRLRAALNLRPENDRLEAMARALQPWLHAAGAEVVEALADRMLDGSVTMLQAALWHEQPSLSHFEACLERADNDRAGLVRVLQEREDTDDVQATCRELVRRGSRRDRLGRLDFAAALLRSPADVRDLLVSAQQWYASSGWRDSGRLFGAFLLAGLRMAVRDPKRPDITPLRTVAEVLVAAWWGEPQGLARCGGLMDTAACAALLRPVPVRRATLPFLQALQALGLDALELQGWAPLLGDRRRFSPGDTSAWLALLRPRLAMGDRSAHLLRALLDRCPDDDLDALLRDLLQQAPAAVADEPLVLLRRLGQLAPASRRAALLELPWPWPDAVRPVLQVLQRWWDAGQGSWLRQFDAPGRVLGSETLGWLLEITPPEDFAELLRRAPVWAEGGRCDRTLASAFAPLAESAAQRERILLRYRLQESDLGWLRWALLALPDALLAVAPRRHDDLDPDVHLDEGDLVRLWRAGRAPFVMRYLADRAERQGGWTSFNAEMAIPLMDHVEEVDGDSLLLALALARLTPRGVEAVDGMARPFDARLGQRLRGRSEGFWNLLACHLADAARDRHDLVFGGVFEAWFAHAPVSGWLDWLLIVQDRGRGELRARCLATVLGRLAAAGCAEEALARLREDGERLAAAHAHAPACAPGTEPWRHALAPRGLRLPRRQVELYLSLGVALLGAPFARACIEGGRTSSAALRAVPDLPLTVRLAIVRRQGFGPREVERALPSHPLRLALAAASLADGEAALRAQPADDFGAALAVVALHHGAAAGDAGRPLAQAAWEALLRCLERCTRDVADDLIGEAAPALGVLFDGQALGCMAADLLLCERWWS